MDKISVIIPVYKVEPFLRQCLDSVVNQTYRNLEIIIVDDGSPDNCGAICDEYARKDDRIQIIHKKNKGLCAARNDGIQRATGEWVTFVDSDDWCELDYYERLVKELGNESPDILCSCGCFYEFSDKQEIAHTFMQPFRYTQKDNIEKLIIDVMVAPQWKKEKNRLTLGAPWDKLYHLDFLKKNKLYFDTTCKAYEDVWFNFQSFDKALFVKGCTYIGYHYRRIGTAITSGFNPYKPKIGNTFISKLYHYIEQREVNSEIIQAIKVRTLSTILNLLKCYYFHPSNDKKMRIIVREIKEMKYWPYFHEAIWSKSNQYLTKKQVVLKYMLRLPWIWPLKCLYMMNEKAKSKR